MISDEKTCLCEADDLSWKSNDAVIMCNDGTSCDETWLQAFLETHSWNEKVKEKKKH
jgi:hypothetical protein